MFLNYSLFILLTRKRVNIAKLRKTMIIKYKTLKKLLFTKFLFCKYMMCLSNSVKGCPLIGCQLFTFLLDIIIQSYFSSKNRQNPGIMVRESKTIVHIYHKNHKNTHILSALAPCISNLHKS